MDAFSLYNADGVALEWSISPAVALISDPISGEPKEVFDQSFRAAFIPQGDLSSLTLAYWGCNDTSCFIPQRKTIAGEAAVEEYHGAIAGAGGKSASACGRLLKQNGLLRFR